MATGPEIFATILQQQSAGTIQDNTIPVDQDEVQSGEYKAGDRHWPAHADDNIHPAILHADGTGWMVDSDGNGFDFDTTTRTITEWA